MPDENSDNCWSFSPDDSLGPRTDAAINEFQREMLDEALSSDYVMNIAISGPFGSGKSTFIKSYEAQRKKSHEDEEPFAYISLAKFEYSGQGHENKTVPRCPTCGKPDEYVEERILEEKIINQIAATPTKKKPFLTKKKSSAGIGSRRWTSTAYPSEKALRNQRALSASVVALVFISALVIALFGLLNTAAITLDPYIIYGTFSLLVALLAVLSIWYARTGCPPILKSIKAGGVGAELRNDPSESSLFDQNMAYILRILDSRDENIFVFEDLDRLSQKDIFTHLRELNKVANEYFGANRTIKFVYCVSDDTISGEGRTKFFDLIVPVVPYADGYNSFGHLSDLLGDAKKGLSEGFLLNVSLYLEDYRLMKSTVTDYRVYCACLDADRRTDLDREKLFSVIALKNAFPEVFKGLQEKSSGLYHLLNADEKSSSKERSNLREVEREEIANAIKGNGNDTGSSEKAVDFLMYLIPGGYLDEGYFFYLAYPDEEALSRNDRGWLLRVRGRGEHENEDYCTVLDRPDRIYTYLQPYSFDDSRMLNVSLLQWVIENKKGTGKALESIVRCVVSSHSEFGKLAVVNVPLFPPAATSIDEIFYREMQEGDSKTKIDRTRFAIPIIGENAHEENRLKKIDSDNDGFISDELRKSAGGYKSELLASYKDLYPDIEKRIADAAIELGVRVEEFTSEADNDLIESIAGNAAYSMTPKNCEIICNRFCDPEHAETDIIDRLKVSRHDVAWDIITNNADLFIKEYMQDGNAKLACTQDAFLEMINLDAADASRRILIKHYCGERISTIESIASTAIWADALESEIIELNLSNAFVTLEKLDAIKQWADWINAYKEFDLSKTELDPVWLESIRNKALACNVLRQERYEAFAEASGKDSCPAVPTGIDPDKIEALFRFGVLALNPQTIAAARQYLDEKGLCDYELSRIDSFIMVNNQVGGATVKELSNIIERLADDDEHIDVMVNSLGQPICASESMGNTVIASLYGKRRLDTNSYPEVVSRYKQNDVLDKIILQIVSNSDESSLVKCNPTVELMCDCLPQCDGNQIARLLLYAGKHQKNVVLSILYAIEDNDLSSIVRGEHPLYNEIAASTRPIIEAMKSLNILSVGGNNRVYLKSSKIKHYSRIGE